MVDELGARLRRLIAEAVAGCHAAAWRWSARACAPSSSSCAEHRTLYRIVRQAEFVDEACFRRYYDRFARGYVRGAGAGHGRGEVRRLDPEALAYCLMGIGDFLGMRWVLWRDEDRAWSACWTRRWTSSATADRPPGRRRSNKKAGKRAPREAETPMRYATSSPPAATSPRRSSPTRELERMLGEPVDEWLVQNVGIQQRHVMADER